MGQLYHKGDKVPRNTQNAIKFLAKADKLGNAEAAKLKIQIENEAKQVVPVCPDSVSRSFNQPNNNNSTVTRLQQEANNGNVNSMFALGTMYLDGTNVTKNLAAAIIHGSSSSTRTRRCTIKTWSHVL